MGNVREIVSTIGIKVAKWMGIAMAWASVSPSGVNRLADASRPSLTTVEKELRNNVDCISFAMPSTLFRTTSSVIGSVVVRSTIRFMALFLFQDQFTAFKRRCRPTLMKDCGRIGLFNYSGPIDNRSDRKACPIQDIDLNCGVTIENH